MPLVKLVVYIPETPFILFMPIEALNPPEAASADALRTTVLASPAEFPPGRTMDPPRVMVGAWAVPFGGDTVELEGGKTGTVVLACFLILSFREVGERA